MYNTHPVLRSAVLGQNCADCMRDFTIDIIEGLRERTKHLYIFFFPSITQWCSISDVLFTGGRGVSDFSVLKYY